MRGDLVWLTLLALVSAALLIVAGQQSAVFRDEFYYLACADRLAWGYVDHPPLSIALLAAVRGAFGDSLLALRAPAALAVAATVLVAGLIARALGGGRGAQLLTALAVAVAPQSLAMSSFYSMNALELLCWAVLQWIAIGLLTGGSRRLWLAFGAVVGIGVLNKYGIALFAAALVAGMLVTPVRRQLVTPWPWLGGVLAVALVAPHLWWEHLHGWPTREFIANAASEKNVRLGVLEFLGGQITLAHPIAAPLWMAGLLALLAARRFAALRPLAIAYLLVFAVLVVQGGKAYYLSPVYPMLYAAGAVVLEAAARRRAWRWPMPAAAALLLVGGIAGAPLAVPLLPPETHIRYAAALGFGPPRMERGAQGALPQHIADRYGWEELTDTLARAVARLPADERRRAVILTRNYGEAGAIEYYGPARGLPRVVSGHNNYWLWGPGDVRPDDPVLVIGRSADELTPVFESIEVVETVRCKYCMPYQNDLPIYLARGLRQPIASLWQQLKRFI